MSFQHKLWPFPILLASASHLVPKQSAILHKFCAYHELCFVSLGSYYSLFPHTSGLKIYAEDEIEYLCQS